MNTQQKIEKIREACIENDPSILDLVFGAKINDFITGYWFFIQKNGDWLECYNGTQICKLNSLEVEIIGRDITLEDVLRVIDRTMIEIRFNSMSFIMRRNYGRKEEPTLWIYWEFGKPLDQQPKETIEFLYDLLIK